MYPFGDVYFAFCWLCVLDIMTKGVKRVKGVEQVNKNAFKYTISIDLFLDKPSVWVWNIYLQNIHLFNSQIYK